MERRRVWHVIGAADFTHALAVAVYNTFNLQGSASHLPPHVARLQSQSG